MGRGFSLIKARQERENRNSGYLLSLCDVILGKQKHGGNQIRDFSASQVASWNTENGQIFVEKQPFSVSSSVVIYF